MKRSKDLLLSVLAVGLLTACAQTARVTGPATPEALEKATKIGTRAGRLTCLGIAAKKPELVPIARDIVSRGEAALAADSLEMGLVMEAMNEIQDPNDRLLFVAGVELLLTGMEAADLDVQTLAPDSALAVGLGGFFSACENQLPPPPQPASWSGWVLAWLGGAR